MQQVSTFCLKRRPHKVGGRNEDQSQKGEQHIVVRIARLVILKVGLAHLDEVTVPAFFSRSSRSGSQHYSKSLHCSRPQPRCYLLIKKGEMVNTSRFQPSFQICQKVLLTQSVHVAPTRSYFKHARKSWTNWGSWSERWTWTSAPPNVQFKPICYVNKAQRSLLSFSTLQKISRCSTQVLMSMLVVRVAAWKHRRIDETTFTKHCFQ